PLHLLQVQRREGPVERHDPHELLTEHAVEEAVRARPLDPDVLARQFDRLVVLDLEIVVVHPPDREGELRGARRRGGSIRDLQLRLRVRRRLELLADDRLEPLRRRLDRALVDVARDPPPAQLLRHRRSRPRAHEAVEDEVAGVGGHANDTLQEGFGLLGGIVRTFLSLRVDYGNIGPDRLQRYSWRLIEIVLESRPASAFRPVDSASGIQLIELFNGRQPMVPLACRIVSAPWLSRGSRAQASGGKIRRLEPPTGLRLNHREMLLYVRLVVWRVLHVPAE